MMYKTLLFACLFGVLAIVACSKNKINGNNLEVNPPVEEPKFNPATRVEDCEQCMVLSEQLENRVAIIDVPSQEIIWEWHPAKFGVKPEHVKWFNAMSDAKVVYDGKYVLACASSGGVALIRIADKKTLFYAYSGAGNTHSIELLPDGNIVSASSTGNYLRVFKVDTLKFPDNVYFKDLPLASGHNMVWDNSKKLMYSVALNKFKIFEYNYNCDKPRLILKESHPIEGTDAHDLFPVYGENALWLTTGTNVYRYYLADNRQVKAADVTIQNDIKSVSSGEKGFPTIILKPKEEWWTDEVVDGKGKRVFYKKGRKIYKARWVLLNKFSYPDHDEVKQCN